MHTAVDSILLRRLTDIQERPTAPLVAAFLLHIAALALFVAAPLLMVQAPEPLEFVDVQIVPLQALGVPQPRPSAPASPPPRQPVAEEEAEKELEKPPAEPVMPAPAEKARPPEPRRAAESAPSPSPSEETGPRQRLGSPLGVSAGTSPLGAVLGGVDNPDFVYSYYVDQMLAMIQSHWVRPSLGGDVEAVLFFRILKTGELTDLRIARSSGYNSFDLAGLRAVQLAAPFPHLPQSYRHPSLGVNLILR